MPWNPNPYDKGLDTHPRLEEVAGPMLRHGISCAATVDLLKVVMSWQSDGNNQYRLPTETELRTVTNRKRASALHSVQLLRIEGLNILASGHLLDL